MTQETPSALGLTDLAGCVLRSADVDPEGSKSGHLGLCGSVDPELCLPSLTSLPASHSSGTHAALRDHLFAQWQALFRAQGYTLNNAGPARGPVSGGSHPGRGRQAMNKYTQRWDAWE